MLYSLSGKLIAKQDNSFAIEVGGVAFQLRSSINIVKSLPQIGESVKVFTHLHVREDALELYGFLDREELEFFGMLISISGIGPKSALGVLGVERVDNLKAAISEGRSGLLTKVSGIGKKSAERIVLELKNKLKQEGSDKLVGIMESDRDIIEALANLGYTKSQAKEALAKVDSNLQKMEERIKAALNFLKEK